MDIRCSCVEEGKGTPCTSLFWRLGWKGLSLRRCYDEPIFGKPKHLAEAFSKPLLLDDKIAIFVNTNPIRKASEHGKQRDLLVEAEVAPSPPEEGERSLAIDRLTSGLHPWRRIMKGEPKVNRPQLSSDTPHRDVLTPEALPPAFDSPGNLDIANIRIVSELTLVH